MLFTGLCHTREIKKPLSFFTKLNCILVSVSKQLSVIGSDDPKVDFPKKTRCIKVLFWCDLFGERTTHFL